MISSVFDKTNPINFFSVLLIFSLHYWFWELNSADFHLDSSAVLLFVAKLALVTFSVFLVEFTVKKNQITSKNTYAILFFILLFGVFSAKVYALSSLVTLFFLLLALRRILSIRSLVSIKLKIFDAALWILVASYFNAFSLYFFIVLFLAIYFYQYNKLKNWLSILIALGTYVLLLAAYLGIDEFKQFLASHYQIGLSFHSFEWNSGLLKLLLVLFFSLIAAMVTFRGLSRSLMGRLISVRLVLISFLIAAVIVVSKNQDQHQLVFLLFPASVLLANALESIRRVWVKDVLLITLAVMPFIWNTL